MSLRKQVTCEKLYPPPKESQLSLYYHYRGTGRILETFDDSTVIVDETNEESIYGTKTTSTEDRC